jgi:hypothetical protein
MANRKPEMKLLSDKKNLAPSVIKLARSKGMRIQTSLEKPVILTVRMKSEAAINK